MRCFTRPVLRVAMLRVAMLWSLTVTTSVAHNATVHAAIVHDGLAHTRRQLWTILHDTLRAVLFPFAMHVELVPERHFP